MRPVQLLTLTTLIAAAAFVPLASADHSACAETDQYATNTCVDAGSSGRGDCNASDGYSSTAVNVDTWSRDRSYRAVGANAWCDSYSYAWDNNTYAAHDHGLYFYEYGSDANGTSDQTSLYWFAWHDAYNGSPYSGCDTQLDLQDSWTQLGCPAGEPPVVPALLP